MLYSKGTSSDLQSEEERGESLLVSVPQRPQHHIQYCQVSHGHSALRGVMVTMVTMVTMV